MPRDADWKRLHGQVDKAYSSYSESSDCSCLSCLFLLMIPPLFLLLCFVMGWNVGALFKGELKQFAKDIELWLAGLYLVVLLTTLAAAFFSGEREQRRKRGMGLAEKQKGFFK